MCQENIGASAYGIFVCGHMAHRDCRSEWENHERVWAPNCLPRCPVCRVEFLGLSVFVSDDRVYFFVVSNFFLGCAALSLIGEYI
jgi:hypothetical protein